MFGLRWEDVDFEEHLVRVTYSIYRGVEGETKTAASHKPVPLPAMVVEELQRWKASSHYNTAKDYLFPSIQKNGKQPLQPDMILKNHIRPALKRPGILKKVGWHTFRHGVADLLRRKRVDLKTAQDLLRHANPRILMQHYQQSVTEEQHEAQELAFDSLMGKSASYAGRRCRRACRASLSALSAGFPYQ